LALWKLFCSFQVPWGRVLCVHREGSVNGVFFASPGSVYLATRSGTWGDARKTTPEIGERYIAASVRSTLAVLDNIEKTFAAMPG
jgi:creatinine amidohydrolase/Fe(II)-dependent formamide hydrolase-like protein